MFSEYAAALRPYSIFGDKRLNAQFPQFLEQLGEHFEQSIPQSSKNNPQMQSIYNFFFQSIGKIRIYATI